MDTVVKMKQKTAYRAVEFGKSGMVVGLENGNAYK
jgi:ribose 5-phosphate isomerase